MAEELSNPASDSAGKPENSGNVYDQAIRHLLQSDPIGMVRWLVPDIPANSRFINWHDTRSWPFPGFGDLICDLVADLSDHPQGKPTHALVLEFMARAKASIFDRALQYVIEAYQRLRHGKDRKGRYQTHVAVINLSGRNKPTRIVSGPPQTPGAPSSDKGWSFAPSIRNLPDDDAGVVLTGIENGEVPFGALALVPLMKDGAKPDIISRWLQSLQKVKSDYWRPNIPPLAVMFSELPKRDKIWFKSLKDRDMLKSKYVEQWQAEARKQGLQEGRQEGLQEGLQKGLEEGRLKQARAALTMVLKARFHDLGGNGLESKIAKQTDSDLLSQWLINATEAASLAQFRKKTNI